jgi:hypothetical protein
MALGAASGQNPGNDYARVVWILGLGLRIGIPAALASTRLRENRLFGIVASNFNAEQFDQNPDLWIPFQMEPDRTAAGCYCRMTARLKPGITLGMVRLYWPPSRSSPSGFPLAARRASIQ